MIGMEITARAHQKDSRKEFGCLRMMSVMISEATVKYRKPCSRRRNLGLEVQFTVWTSGNGFLWTEV